MPLYVYTCGKHPYERVYLNFEASPRNEPCPYCEKVSHRQISAPRFVIQGQESPIDTMDEAWDGLPVDRERVDRMTHEKFGGDGTLFFDQKPREDPA